MSAWGFTASSVGRARGLERHQCQGAGNDSAIRIHLEGFSGFGQKAELERCQLCQLALTSL